MDILKTQLVLKGVIAIEEWDAMKEHIQFDFMQDGHFTELKNAEILQNRLDMLGQIESYVGTYFSKEYVKKNVLRMNDEEIEEIEQQIKDESGSEMEIEDDGMFATNNPDLEIDNGQYSEDFVNRLHLVITRQNTSNLSAKVGDALEIKEKMLQKHL